jgi:hypothetical protein
MLELITAAPQPITATDARASEPPSRYAPLFTAGTEPYALATLDELGRPLAGVYVPDHLLL